jgi:uncharacterized protein YjhX (UPF0386 family)
MNISKNAQRVLHVLSQGGCIRVRREAGQRVSQVECVTRDGMRLAHCDLELFAKLKRKRLIESRASQPYRISRRGREAVRPQLDNRGLK